MPDNYPVKFVTSLTTDTGNRTALSEGLDSSVAAVTRNPVYSVFTSTSTQNFLLIQEPDVLLFGTNYYSTVITGRSITRLSVRNQSGNALDSNNSNTMPWTFSFLKPDGQMRDYTNAQIVITPQTSEDAKALSKLIGFSTSNLTIGAQIQQFVVSYTTNKHPEGRTITYSSLPGTVSLTLDSDEYVTGSVIISLGTIYGDKMASTNSTTVAKTTGNNTGEVWNFNSSNTAYSITPVFNGYRYYYYTGSANGTPVQASDSHKLVATFTTDSTAQYINGAATLTNSTSTGTINYVTNWTSTISNNATGIADAWSNASRTYYQGSTMSFDLYDYFKSSSNILVASGASLVTNSFVHPNLLLYLEVAKDFSIQSISFHTLLEVRPLANGNSLYVFKRNTITSFYGVSDSIYPYNKMTVKAYVHPDAHLSTTGTPVIVSGGFAWDGFVAANMTPSSGTNAYDNNSPFYTLAISERNFPTGWNIANAAPSGNDPYGSAEYQLAFSTPTNVYVQLALLDRVTIQPDLSGVIYSDAATFYDHNKDELAARSWISNVTLGTIQKYEVVYSLPRAGQVTDGILSTGDTGTFTDDFSMYLTGPVTLSGNPENLAITYLDVDGNSVNITASSSAAELRSVVSIRVYFENFPTNTSYSANIPVETDYVKRGNLTGDITSYIGAKRRYTAIAGQSIDSVDYLYSVPAKYIFASYSLTSKVLLDSDETGSAPYSTNNVALITVYYKDETGAEAVLYSSSTGNTHTMKVNADVTRITSQIIPGMTSTYGYTIQNASGVSEVLDSDFPRVEPSQISSLNIDINDLINNTADKYNAGLIYLPKATISNHILRVGETANAVTVISRSATIATQNLYLKSFTSENDSIATVSSAGNITGVKVGITPYDLLLTNVFGQNSMYKLNCDTTSAIGSIKVIPDVKAAVRLFYDTNYNGQYDEGETIVANPTVKLSATLTGTGITSGTYNASDGYLYFSLPDTANYYISATNPGSTVVTDANAERFATTVVVKGQGAISTAYTNTYNTYSTAYLAYNFANYFDNYYNAGFDQNNLTTYVDFALQAPHTVTYRALNGDVANTVLLPSGFVSQNGSNILTDADGNTYMQQKVWHNYILTSNQSGSIGNKITFGSYVMVTPDVHYAWSTSTALRNWRYEEGAVTRSENAWYTLGMPVVSDMTMTALPVATAFLVTYNPNSPSATGSVTDPNWYPTNTNATILSNGYTNPYHQFVDWNTAADGSGTAYQPNGTILVGGNTTLYAQWNTAYTVEHYLQNADGSGYTLVTADSQTLYAKTGTTVSSDAKSYENYKYNPTRSNASGIVIEPVLTPSGATVLALRFYYDTYPQMVIEKTTTQTEVYAGEEITYTVRVSNTGTGNANHVVIDEKIPAGSTFVSATASDGSYDSTTNKWSIPTVAVGGSSTLTLKLRTSENAKQGSTITNIALVKSIDGIDLTEPPEAIVETPVHNYILAIQKNTTQSSTRPGDNVTYTIDVSNTGRGAARDVLVQEAIPANATFVSASVTAGSYDPGTAEWSIARIASGGTETLTIVFRVNPDAPIGDKVLNIATVTKAEGDPLATPLQDDAFTTVAPLPNLTILKTPAVSFVRSGDEIAYTITVTNSGEATAIGVSVLEKFPAGTVFRSAQVFGDYNAATDTYQMNPASFDPITGIWDVGDIPAHSNVRMLIVLRVNSDVADQITLKNIVELTKENGKVLPVPLSSETATPVMNPILSITKTASQSEIRAGEDIIYTILVSNKGSGTAKGVTVVETPSDELLFKSVTTGTGSYDTTTNVWTIGDIAAFGTVTMSITFTVKSDTATGTTVKNTVAVTKENGGSPSSPIIASAEATVLNTATGGEVMAVTRFPNTVTKTGETEQIVPILSTVVLGGSVGALALLLLRRRRNVYNE